MAIVERGAVATGRRVQIRPFTRADVDVWQDWPDYREPLLASTSPRRMTPQQRDRWYEDLIYRQRQRPFSVEDERGEMIGRLFLRHVRPEEGSAVLGIDLHPDKLGVGYGTEALSVFLHHFYEEMGFTRMLLSVAAFNERARRSYVSLGFRTIGSHWDAYSGPDATRDPHFSDVSHLFRHSGLGLEALYYDMSLDRAQWRNRQRGAGTGA